ncbi:unnamed protein product [Parascedosporium putredinis]|uniref:Cardiolipin synthase N-terminal domain-containing protein n=1 Tax=Parascedosporium putredinis TaxID=1442378 RepID=A0A9P1H347_9PEZI|nr:unnamed protein product [Parascedosporium putredinis]CAI7994218.1 unnamed protein product [Parascedosporium putredinis]
MFQFNILLQLLLASLAFAAPIETADHGNAWQYGTGGGIIGLIVLILDVIVFSLQVQPSPVSKLLWCLVVFLFPIVGMVIYYLFSNRDAHKTGAGYEPLS